MLLPGPIRFDVSHPAVLPLTACHNPHPILFYYLPLCCCHSIISLLLMRQRGAQVVVPERSPRFIRLVLLRHDYWQPAKSYRRLEITHRRRCGWQTPPFSSSFRFNLPPSLHTLWILLIRFHPLLLLLWLLPCQRTPTPTLNAAIRPRALQLPLWTFDSGAGVDIHRPKCTSNTRTSSSWRLLRSIVLWLSSCRLVTIMEK